MQAFPDADVIWWNATDYHIQCPFCNKVHRHSVNWEAANTLRASHCGNGGHYRCCFPLSDRGEVAYEIDKKRGRYTNICVSQENYGAKQDDVDLLALELAEKASLAAQREAGFSSIHEESREVIINRPGHGIQPFEQKRIRGAISDCVNGNVESVQQYLETSSEAQLFLRGRFPDGQTPLIAAATEQSSAMITLLIKRGADIDATGNNGRTALMEAALFGWIDNVKVLLEHGADKNIRDGESRRAIEFARDLPKNRREVYDRTAVTSTSRRRLGYIEDTFSRDIDREEILRLLGGEDRKSKIVFGGPPTLSTLRSYSFEASASQGSLVLRGPVEEYPITRANKTVARLERGGKFPSVGAMSGWGHCPIQSLRVDGKQWTENVFYISEVVGHNLLPLSKDQGKDGQYNACHAEKQLIAYFIDRHVFLPRDGLSDASLEAQVDSQENEIEEVLSSTEIGRRVVALRQEKKDLEDELFDGDEKLVGRYEEIKTLKSKLRSTEKRLAQLLASHQARPILKLEAQLEVLNQRLRRHTDLTHMAHAPPPVSLTEAVILISSSPCSDCIAFKEKVNRFLKLSINLFAAV
ncbi:hypothetical protein N7468_009913 [Penicillium chermesinum]|uniref:Single-strand DNA deaminase toxin A-like C-terminal domain-containing protein n=1 Tax=Penicillium chermesinum TaxID=63820 RepID=A0A9W9TCU4_9EURO|nr:uncharacterized protein N7468_009913 [Penicillium chermesinum]KAJ5216905.1 hypothetical protein N7468_009913 [Penicillium chermesinum]KAJ6171482.1 hypothetical protein N7470_000549 [Penicillium chermesinum]